MKLNEVAGLVFKKTQKQTLSESIETDRDSLRLLSAIDGRKSLAALAVDLDMELKDAAVAVLKLQFHQVVEIIRPNSVTQVVLGPKFMEFVVEQFTLAVGPLASVVVQDVAREMGYAIDRVPKQRALQFISKLSVLIQNVQKRQEFESSVQKFIH